MTRTHNHTSHLWRIFLVLFALVFTADVMGISYMDVVPGTCIELTDSELEDTSEEESETDAKEWYCFHALDLALLYRDSQARAHHSFVPHNVCAVPPTPPPEVPAIA